MTVYCNVPLAVLCIRTVAGHRRLMGSTGPEAFADAFPVNH